MIRLFLAKRDKKWLIRASELLYHLLHIRMLSLEELV